MNHQMFASFVDELEKIANARQLLALASRAAKSGQSNVRETLQSLSQGGKFKTDPNSLAQIQKALKLDPNFAPAASRFDSLVAGRQLGRQVPIAGKPTAAQIGDIKATQYQSNVLSNVQRKVPTAQPKRSLMGRILGRPAPFNPAPNVTSGSVKVDAAINARAPKPMPVAQPTSAPKPTFTQQTGSAFGKAVDYTKQNWKPIAAGAGVGVGGTYLATR